MQEKQGQVQRSRALCRRWHVLSCLPCRLLCTASALSARSKSCKDRMAALSLSRGTPRVLGGKKRTDGRVLIHCLGSLCLSAGFANSLQTLSVVLRAGTCPVGKRA